jgi:RNA polymerase sigma-70 factor (ECF subfamily)
VTSYPERDEVLVRRLRNRDEAAFTGIVEAWSPGMVRLARPFVTTSASAEDVVQDTWVAVVNGLSAFEGRSSLRTWVYRILVNTAKRRGQRESRTVPWSSWAPDEVELATPTVDPSRFQGPAEPYPGHWREFPQTWSSPETESLDAELRATVNESVQQLPQRQRIVITLRDIEGYTSDEVCSILDISAVNQRVLLHRARATVRSRLEAYFEMVDGGARAAREEGIT